jgi:hypothetical protein
MTEQLVEAYVSALHAMEGGAPKNLVIRATLEASELDADLDASEPRFREYLAASGPNDRLRVELHLNLLKWDNAPTEANPWTGGTSPNTEQRRAMVLTLLKLDADTADEINKQLHIARSDGTTVIAGPWDPWYTPEIQRERNFYWDHYTKYLQTRRHWSAEAIANLDTASTHVVERVVDPSREKAGRTKGLVVGYVQSGKTANFTGVIAKAIDAGYRLIIVMTGTTNLLREQTQRRLDMELVGRENVLRGINETDPGASQLIDYVDDEDWINNRFLSHEVRPSDIGRPDIHRMTTRNFDYRRLQQGLPALEFERRDRTKPLWHPENLYTSDARLIIVKKNSSVLRNLIKDLKNNADKLDDIPALIIDDESDQASVNTTDPKKWESEKKKRTAINQHLSDLLKMLPRVQYVGYTATPFANVFVDPLDAIDIFPGDYIISLERPAGYMGAGDFHDLDHVVPEVERTFANSKEKAHIRLVGKKDDEAELRWALDSFVLTGAVKLYREAHGSTQFKHHTMLVHETMRKAGQKSRADSIKDLWHGGGYLSGGAYGRLRTLFDDDFSPVTTALALGDPMPSSFEELQPYLGAAARRIAPHGNPVLVVNSDTDIEQEDVDFDKRPVWRILVGGNKLARGFTIEGLTVTYYSREVGHAEALMQMGRWFGFRPGYRDLVRLFITPSVCNAFEAASLDEENFREELRQYAAMVDGRPEVTPYDVQPMVFRHGLRPTAANKMHLGELVERRTLTKEPSSGYPDLDDQEALDHNIDACVPLLRAAKDRDILTSEKGSYHVLRGTVPQADMIDVLSRMTWAKEDTFDSDLKWMSKLPDRAVENWIVLMPQLQTREPVNFRDEGLFTIHGRKVEPKGRIRGNSESAHRPAVDKLLADRPRTGCVLLYPVMDVDHVRDYVPRDGRPQGVVMALRLQLPIEAAPADRRPLVYQVRPWTKLYGASGK